MKKHPLYADVIRQGKDTSRSERLLLDVGTAVGTDARKAVDDGWPAERVYAVDISKGGVQTYSTTTPQTLSTF